MKKSPTAPFLIRAENEALETPLSASIQLDVSLRPEAVKITGNAPFRGQYGYMEVSCFSCTGNIFKRINIVKKLAASVILYFYVNMNMHRCPQPAKCLFLSKC
jgi:hypothetical protein